MMRGTPDWQALWALVERRQVYALIGGRAEEALVADMDARIGELVAGLEHGDRPGLARRTRQGG